MNQEQSNNVEGFVNIVPITNQVQFTDAKRVADENDHDLIAPSHVIVKWDKVVGYLSIANIPVFIGCIGKDKVSPRDSFNVIHIAENIMRGAGAKAMLMPLGSESPFHPLAEKMGFVKLANVDLFVKEFKQ